MLFLKFRFIMQKNIKIKGFFMLFSQNKRKLIIITVSKFEKKGIFFLFL